MTDLDYFIADDVRDIAYKIVRSGVFPYLNVPMLSDKAVFRRSQPADGSTFHADYDAKTSVVPRWVRNAFQKEMGDLCFMIEVYADNYDSLPDEQKMEVIFHELMHLQPASVEGELKDSLRTHNEFRDFWRKFKEFENLQNSQVPSPAKTASDTKDEEA